MLFLSILYILCTSCVLFIAIHNNILIILYINKNIIFNLIYFFFYMVNFESFPMTALTQFHFNCLLINRDAFVFLLLKTNFYYYYISRY